MEETFGKPISREEAQKCINQYFEIITALTKNVLSNESIQQFENVQTFFQGGYNGFIFDRSLVTRFFEGNANAQYLVVLLGAQASTDEKAHLLKNSPTVILVGCNRTKEGKFVSVLGDNPGTEHPPFRIFSVMPIEGNNMVFGIDQD
jgi:hypothetical protein